MISVALTFVLLAAYQCAADNRFLADAKGVKGKNNDTKREVDDDNALKSDVKRYVKECSSDIASDEDSNVPKEDFGDMKGANSGTNHEFDNSTVYKQNKDSNRTDRRSTGRNNSESPFDVKRNHVRNEQNAKSDDRNYRRNGAWRDQNVDQSDRTVNHNRYYVPINDRPLIDGNFGAFNTRWNYYGDDPRFPDDPRRYGGIRSYDRAKRDSDDDNCISQCIFGYLNVLDDNRVPSETAVIKYLQDHVPNDTKRIQYVRDARRCFATLATTDNEDGCSLSKMLAKCLKLDIE